MVAAVTVSVVHLWNTHEQRVSTQHRLASLHLTALVEGTTGDVNADGVHGVWGAEVRIRSGPDQAFRVLAVTPDEHVWKVEPASLPEDASTTHLVAVTFAGSCAQVERIASPTRLQVSGRRPGGPLISRLVSFDGNTMMGPPRRSCGFADLASSLASEVTGGRRRGPVVTMDVQLRNPSRHAGRLTALNIAATQVTTRRGLPVVLPPSVGGHPGTPLRLQLTVRYVFCFPAGQDTDLNLDLIDDAHNPDTVVVGQDGPTSQLLDQLAGDTCRK